MTTIVSIDGAGRVVLPKKVREQLNLRAGSQLELAAHSASLELKPLELAPGLVREDGLWIHHGVAQAPLGEAVRRLRDERADTLGRRAAR